MATTVEHSGTAYTPTTTGTAAAASAAAVPWYLYAVATAATFVLVGIIWDISWHMTIGRDTFWSPPHMCTYAAALIVGATCGWVALRTTFRGTVAERERAVGFWGFRAPLGAWVCTWGAFAMLTSAPFDDWWHNAYGLDVKIISPPHTLLSLGMVAMVIGALVWILAEQNRVDDGARRARMERLFVYVAGIMLSMMAIYLTEYSWRGFHHGSRMYRMSALLYPLLLVAVARGSSIRWSATKVALVYMATRMVMGWVLPLFPAEPKLGPIYMPLERMAAMEFPLLLVAPGIAIDLVMQRWGRPAGRARDWAVAAALGVAFVVAFVAAQWPFADFLHSPLARNWFFFTDANFSYGTRPTSMYATYRYFPNWVESGAVLVRGLGIAAVFAMLSSRVGLAWGNWMTGVRR